MLSDGKTRAYLPAAFSLPGSPCNASSPLTVSLRWSLNSTKKFAARDMKREKTHCLVVTSSRPLAGADGTSLRIVGAMKSGVIETDERSSLQGDGMRGVNGEKSATALSQAA